MGSILTVFISHKEFVVFYIFFLSENEKIQSMAPTLLAKRISDDRNYTSTNGLCVAINYLGCALSPLILNIVYERAGSYNPVLIADLGLIAIASIFLIAERKNQAK